MVDGERWRRAEELFDLALERPETERRPFLEDRCGGDGGLLAEVLDMLDADERLRGEDADFLDTVIGEAATLVDAGPPVEDTAEDSPSAGGSTGSDDPYVRRGRFGKYEVLEKVGEGGFGQVYRGRDPVLGREVAIKTCTSKDERLRQRFLREAKIAAGLQHPNIVTVHDFGHGGEDRPDAGETMPFLVQEFLTGEDLVHKIRRREPLDLETRLDYLRQIALGLAHAHDHGVLHRDIKPGNVRVTADGRLKILDFGIARLLDDKTGFTSEGVTLGTVGYLAPEQLSGDPVDARSDMFSFGVLAYELMSFERPFDGPTFSRVSYQLLYEEPPPLLERAPDCPPALSTLVTTCLRKRPSARFADFRPILAELDSLSQGTGAYTAAATEPLPTRPGPSPGRLRWGWGAAVGAVLLAGWWFLGGASPDQDPAATSALDQSSEGAGTEPGVSEMEDLSGPQVHGDTGGAGPGEVPPDDSESSGTPGPTAPEPPERGPTLSKPDTVDAEDPDAGTAPETAQPPARIVSEVPEGTPNEARPQAGDPKPGPADAERAQVAAVVPPRLDAVTPPVNEGPLDDPASAGAGGEIDDGGPGGESLGGEALDGGAPADGGTAPGPGVQTSEAEPETVVVTAEAPVVRVAPRLLEQVSPTYPPIARRRGLEARVVVAVLVDTDGAVERSLIKSSTAEGAGFEAAAADAARRSRFQPGLANDVPVRTWAELVFEFRLE
ncbi:MAG: TonB family protein [Acidobacteriota bacterium]